MHTSRHSYWRLLSVIGEVDMVEREVDGSGQVYMTAAELMAEEVKRRGGERPLLVLLKVDGDCGAGKAASMLEKQESLLAFSQTQSHWSHARSQDCAAVACRDCPQC